MPDLVVGPYLFKTKKAAKDECKRVLNAYSLGATLQEPDAGLVLGALELHGGAEHKIGCGVASFQVEVDSYGHRCFWLTRLDGSRTYFSYKWCFDKPPDGLQRARFAFRCEIQAQVIAFKTEAFQGRPSVPCAATGTPLDWNSANVDHEPPLRVLRDTFLAAVEMRLADVVVQPWCEGEHRYLFADRRLATVWQQYHLEHARLQILSAEENSKKGGRG